ncbi:uncharacterized protein C8Q71DRAFT_140483 [Rhodofomes roseus]|uniref:Uncharacterized protein n=1 Tax=Rhodofomes roseus TaxID=34475 RepID=A0ABQ8KAK1_9APHY|nr:uncharacterized protein C8Q71DRAFT_140483 [Rhodofomes roseus]KAH9834424.1 hypothetical protein C8Q71DRAFT_140483 [Rhodofomes roseus]
MQRSRSIECFVPKGHTSGFLFVTSRTLTMASLHILAVGRTPRSIRTSLGAKHMFVDDESLYNAVSRCRSMGELMAGRLQLLRQRFHVVVWRKAVIRLALRIYLLATTHGGRVEIMWPSRSKAEVARIIGSNAVRQEITSRIGLCLHCVDDAEVESRFEHGDAAQDRSGEVRPEGRKVATRRSRRGSNRSVPNDTG